MTKLHMVIIGPFWASPVMLNCDHAWAYLWIFLTNMWHDATRHDQAQLCMHRRCICVWFLGDASQKSPTSIEFPCFSDKIIFKECVSCDRNMPSCMGSIAFTHWLQQQIWANIDQLQTHTQHDTWWPLENELCNIIYIYIDKLVICFKWLIYFNY